MWSWSLIGTRRLIGGLLPGQFVEGVENAIGAGIHRDWGKIAPGDGAVFVDEEESALAVAVFLPISAIRFGDGAFRFEIGEQREVDVAILGKGFVAPDTID